MSDSDEFVPIDETLDLRANGDGEEWADRLRAHNEAAEHDPHLKAIREELRRHANGKPNRFWELMREQYDRQRWTLSPVEFRERWCVLPERNVADGFGL